LKRIDLFGQGLFLRKGANFILSQANFAVECGRFGEKFNAAQEKIGRLQQNLLWANKSNNWMTHPGACAFTTTKYVEDRLLVYGKRRS